MDLQLENKVAVVTGASRGIGRAISERLSSEGMRVVSVARTGDVTIHADLRNADAAQQVVDDTIKQHGQLDVLVNNAGATKRADFFKLSDDDWADGFALKFFGAMRLARAAWPHLCASGGSIVNIAGVGGRTGNAEFTIGGSVNAAVMYLTKALADRGMRDGVRVNAINPGSIATERLRARNLNPSDLGIPRFGEPDEIARAVAFLASPAAAYCQGVILDVDGGATRTL